MKKLILAFVFFVTTGFAHNSYTGGYSGAPGSPTCASSCHGGSAGTLLVTGFPASYKPGQIYRIVIKHNGGSAIVNFNATTRAGSTTSVAGTFAVVTNSALYGGADGGVYASPHAIDSAVFQWTAPSKGTGQVKFYAAAFQGSTSSSNGQNSTMTGTAAEITTGLAQGTRVSTGFSLDQNFPNPFNPSTTIKFEIPRGMIVHIAVYDGLGREVSVLMNDRRDAGIHEVRFNGSNLASGVYVYRMRAGSFIETKKLLLIR
jgi:hypothetical protein